MVDYLTISMETATFFIEINPMNSGEQSFNGNFTFSYDSHFFGITRDVLGQSWVMDMSLGSN